MADFTLQQSSMLELALEAQFVETQRGGNSEAFEARHTQRIRECLDLLDSRINHQTNIGEVRVNSPHAYDVVGLRHVVPELVDVTELDLDSSVESTSTCKKLVLPLHHRAVPETTTSTQSTSHSVLGIPNLIHPDMGLGDLTKIGEVDTNPNMEMSLEDLGVDTQFTRANHAPPAKTARSIKLVRQRREAKLQHRHHITQCQKGLKSMNGPHT